MKHTLRTLRIGLAVAAILTAARAQTADTSVVATAPAPSDQVITLNAFDVTADAAHGYVASEATTGTRVANKIQNLPFSVNVVTADFMNDLGLFDLNSQLGFVSGFSPSETYGQFQLRGFPSPITLVDGFRRLGAVDTVDIQRFEIIKGTVGSIYGAVPPGGVVNYVTREPSTTPSQEITLGGGTDDFERATVYSSGPLGDSGKLFYLFDAADLSNKYAEEFASRHSTYISGKLVYKPDAATDIKLDFEHTELYEHPFSQVLTVTEKQTMPWAANSITESQYYGNVAGTSLQNYNYAGPESYDHRRLTSLTGSLEHRFSDIYSIRLGVNAFNNPYNDQLVGSGAYYPYGTGNVTLVGNVVQQAFTPEVKDQPQVDWNPQRGGGAQLDNSFNFTTGPVKNRFLVTADYYELSQRSFTLAAAAGVNSGTVEATDYYALYSPYNPSGASYYTPASSWTPANGYGWNTTMYGANPGIYSDIITDQWTAFGDYGLFANEQASLFNDKLIFTAGGRFDYVRNQIKNFNIPGPGGAAYAIDGPEPTPYQAFDYNTQGYTYQLGVTYAIVPGVNIYANKSSGFNPQPQIDSYTGLALPNNTSQGYEIGLKTSLLNGRLNLTADRFLINEYNLAQTETDPVTGVKDTILAGLERSQGYEFDATYGITDNLYFQGNWGYTNAKVLDVSTLTFYEDLPIRRVPRNNVGGLLRYQFTGGLRGLYVYGGGRYYSKSLINLGSGKSLVPGPASTTVGSTTSMYYVPSQNLTYTSGTDPKLAGEIKVTSTPFNNVPFPASGLLPYPAQPAGALINYPVNATGVPLPLQNAGTPNVYVGEPVGVFVDDGRELIYNAPYAVFNIGTGYNWKMGRFSHKVQINVSNLFNRVFTYGSGAPGAPFQIYTQYSLGF